MASDSSSDSSSEGSRAGLRRSPIPSRPEIHQIVLPTPWPIGPVQIYLIESEPLTLIDTGVRSPESRAVLEAALDELGHGFEDVRRVVLTHFHEDHLGQAQMLREHSPELEVWCHEDEREWCEDFSAMRNEWVEPTEALFRESGVPEDVLVRQSAERRRHAQEDPLCDPTRIDRTLRDGDRVPFKDLELGVIHAPGHTQGHLLLHDPDAGVLFTGDHLMGNAVPFTFYSYLLDESPEVDDLLARRPRFRGLPLYLASLRSLRRQKFRTILPAHGGILDRPDQVIQDAILFYEVRIQRIERGLAAAVEEFGRPVSAYDVWRRVFPKADPVSEMRTRLYMVLGALDWLADQGRVAIARDADGILVYTPFA